MVVIPARSSRVAVITNIVAPYRTPTLRELAERVELRVFYCSETEENREWSVPDELPFDYEVIGGPALPARGRTIYLNPRLLTRLRAFDPTVVVTGGFSAPSLYALGYCAARRAGLVIISEETADTEPPLGVSRRVARRALIWRAKAFIGVSGSAARQFENLGAPRSRCVVVPYALDIEARPTRQYETSGGDARLLFVGQFIHRKGIMQLLEAFQRLRERHDVSLTIVGHGPLELDLRETIQRLGLQKSVTVLGFVDQPALPAVYAEHDLFVFPSLEDPFGVVLLEAMAAGLPVVASILAGATADFVDAGRNGWIMDPRELDGFTEVLETALASRDRWPRLGAAARGTMERASPSRAADEVMRALSWAGLPDVG